MPCGHFHRPSSTSNLERRQRAADLVLVRDAAKGWRHGDDNDDEDGAEEADVCRMLWQRVVGGRRNKPFQGRGTPSQGGRSGSCWTRQLSYSVRTERTNVCREVLLCEELLVKVKKRISVARSVC